MKFTILLALATTFTSVISAPAAAVDTSIEKRQTTAASIISTLNSAIAAPIADIQSTLSTISASSSAADKSTAESAIKGSVSEIVTAVNTATTSVKALPAGSESTKKLRARQDALQSALTALLTEIDGIASTLVTDLGLGSTLSILSPLTSALSNLLLALEVVVNDLLALVQEIVDDLLNGLSSGLAGLTL